MQTSMKITYILNFNVLTNCEFSVCYKIIFWFFLHVKVQISTNYEKILLKFIVLTRQGTMLAVVMEITSIKKYNFRIKSGMRKVYCKKHTECLCVYLTFVKILKVKNTI